MELLFGSFFVYIGLALYGLCLKGWKWKVAASVPLIPMIYVTWVTADLYKAEATLWPINLLFASPVALIYIVIVLVCYWACKSEI